jgi:uncharacterized protein
MRPTLAELTQSQQERLQQIVDIIKGASDIEILVLISCSSIVRTARSCFVPDNSSENLCFTFLVITHSDCIDNENAVQDVIENRCRKLASVTAIVHRLQYVKHLLQNRNAFISTLCKEGLILYDAQRDSLDDLLQATAEANPDSISPHRWKKWLETAESCLLGAQFFYEKGIFKMSAFMLHQAAEHSLVGLIQAYTGYRAGTHSLDKLLRYSEICTIKLTELFPRNTLEEIEIFKRLNAAYIETRYKDEYTIKDAEITLLSRRVSLLHAIVNELCQQKNGNEAQNYSQELVASLNH